MLSHQDSSCSFNMNLFQPKGPPGNFATKSLPHLHTNPQLKCYIPFPRFHRNNLKPAFILSSISTHLGRSGEDRKMQMGRQFWWEAQEGHGILQGWPAGSE